MESISLAIEDGIARIALQRPAVRNAITVDLIRELRAATATVTRADVAAVVLHGTDGSFCAGADLVLVRQALDGEPSAVLQPLIDELHAAIRELHALPCPTVVALEGYAVGAGMGLALAADLRIAGRSVRLVPGYFGIGASPDGGVSYFLTRALGGARAAGLILRNRSLDADELLAAGLVEEVVDDGEVITAATRLAATLRGTPPLALVRMRRLVDQATIHGLDAHLDAERDAVKELWKSQDFQEGISAFVERRAPAFEGR